MNFEKEAKSDRKILGKGVGGGEGGPGTETKTTDCVKRGKYENATIYTM